MFKHASFAPPCEGPQRHAIPDAIQAYGFAPDEPARRTVDVDAFCSLLTSYSAALLCGFFLFCFYVLGLITVRGLLTNQVAIQVQPLHPVDGLRFVALMTEVASGSEAVEYAVNDEYREHHSAAHPGIRGEVGERFFEPGQEHL